MLPGKKYTPDDLLRLLVRRKWIVAFPFAAAVIASVLIAQRIPKVYRSETLIMVVPQRIPDDYVKPTDATRIEDRLQSISEQIQSRSRLERIIIDFNLYSEQRARSAMEDVVQQMRQNIRVDFEGRGQDAFRVSYVSSEPHTAQRVTERLASWYIDENLRDRQRLSTSTNEFLEAQLEDAKRRLIEHEEKLEAYRRRYSGQLPSQLETNLQAIQNTQMQLQSVSESINRARERRLLIERQLADARMLPADIPAAGTASTQDSPHVPAAQQLEAAEAALERARFRYTADHPDIRALERTIRDLKVKAAADAQRGPATDARPLSPSEAARQKRLNDLQAEIDVIDRQIVAGQAAQTNLQQRLADYQAKVDAVPSRESELTELTRDYGTLQATYTSLLTKREDSKLAASLERQQIGEQFKVLDPASLPERPVNAKQRMLVMLGGSGGGLLLGLMLVGFLEYRDSTLKTEADVAKVLDMPVLALVPMMLTDAGRAVARRRRFLVGVATIVALSGSAAALALWVLQS